MTFLEQGIREPEKGAKNKINADVVGEPNAITVNINKVDNAIEVHLNKETDTITVDTKAGDSLTMR